MKDKEICFLSACEMAAAVKKKKLSPVEVVDAVLARIDKINPKVNAYCTVVPEMARERARQAETEVMKGERIGPLHGVPVSIKDLTLTSGIRTTWGSKIYQNFVPQEDALVVQRLKTAGAIILGKTNTPEFGAGANTYNAVFGATHNPWNLSYTCGGSSGGSAVALACGLGPLATGSDLGGSLRIPASFCGVVGFRTSAGLVPIYPGLTGWDTLAVEGPMARRVKDIALMLSATAGADERSPISFPVDTREFLAAVKRPDIKGLRVAWSPDLKVTAVDHEVEKVAGAAARRFAELGCAVEQDEPDFSGVQQIIHVTRALRMVTLHAEKLEKWRDQVNPNLVWNIEQGFPLTSSQVGEADKGRTALYHRVRQFFEKYDLLLTPTVAVPPFPQEMIYPKEINGKPIKNYQEWLYLTYALTITSLPVISVPCGFTSQGLPVGLQIVGRRLAEGTVLKAAAAFEEMAPWEDKRPPVD